MPYLVAAVVIVGAIGTLNLILTTAIVRRMRVYERGPSSVGLLGGLPAGAALPTFTGTPAAGGTLTDGDLRGRPAAVAFLSTDCPSCLEHAPDFAATARATLARGGRAVAVIIEGDEPVDALTAAVGPATAVYEPMHPTGPMTRAFEVKSFPTFFVMDEAGMIASRELDLAGAGAA